MIGGFGRRVQRYWTFGGRAEVLLVAATALQGHHLLHKKGQAHNSWRVRAAVDSIRC